MDNAFQTKKNAIEKKLAEELLGAVERQIITLKEVKPISTELLEKLEKAPDEAALQLFLDEAAAKWSFFAHIKGQNQEPERRSDEKKIIDKLSQYINSFNS